VDVFRASTFECRGSAGQCDEAETCTGTSGTCPADGYKAAGTTCTDDGNGCTSDICSGTSAACTHPSNGICNAQITPTETTCSQFASGTAADLNEGAYNAKGTAIISASPGVMFYYARIIAPSSSFRPIGISILLPFGVQPLRGVLTGRGGSDESGSGPWPGPSALESPWTRPLCPASTILAGARQLFLPVSARVIEPPWRS
jgi:hypothetical protein